MAQFTIDKAMIYERSLMREGEIEIGRHRGLRPRYGQEHCVGSNPTNRNLIGRRRHQYGIRDNDSSTSFSHCLSQKHSVYALFF